MPIGQLSLYQKWVPEVSPEGLKAALHILMIVSPPFHSYVHSSPVGPLLSHSLLQWFVHLLYHSLPYSSFTYLSIPSTSSSIALPHFTVCHILTLSCDKLFFCSLKLFLIFCFKPHSFILLPLLSRNMLLIMNAYISVNFQTTKWPQLYTRFYWLCCLECKLNFLC